jgi:NAD(P)-dependent dehydrogenase (short-subunit alcohol dehydrogenase family)
VLNYRTDKTENAMDTLIVTGASRGIGAAVARLAAKQYSVVVNYSRDETAASEVVRQITASGGRAVAVQADVSIEKDVLRLFVEVEKQLGPVRALVNNAGITGGFSRVEKVASETLARVFAVNVTGTILCSREAVRRMSTRNGGAGGAIVNVSSRASEIGGAGEWVHYAASKGAVDTFTIGLAREIATEGIRVNAVSPGLISTELHAAAGAPDRVERMAPSIPMKRAGTAEEVAEGILWLLSPAASYVTGVILPISGGR